MLEISYAADFKPDYFLAVDFGMIFFASKWNYEPLSQLYST